MTSKAMRWKFIALAPQGPVDQPPPRGEQTLDLFLLEDVDALLLAALGERVVAAVVAHAVGLGRGSAARAIVRIEHREGVVGTALASAGVGVTALGIGHDATSVGRREAPAAFERAEKVPTPPWTVNRRASRSGFVPPGRAPREGPPC